MQKLCIFLHTQFLHENFSCTGLYGCESKKFELSPKLTKKKIKARFTHRRNGAPGFPMRPLFWHSVTRRKIVVEQSGHLLFCKQYYVTNACKRRKPKNVHMQSYFIMQIEVLPSGPLKLRLFLRTFSTWTRVGFCEDFSNAGRKRLPLTSFIPVLNPRRNFVEKSLNIRGSLNL